MAEENQKTNENAIEELHERKSNEEFRNNKRLYQISSFYLSLLVIMVLYIGVSQIVRSFSVIYLIICIETIIWMIGVYKLLKKMKLEEENQTPVISLAYTLNIIGLFMEYVFPILMFFIGLFFAEKNTNGGSFESIYYPILFGIHSGFVIILELYTISTRNKMRSILDRSIILQIFDSEDHELKKTFLYEMIIQQENGTINFPDYETDLVEYNQHNIKGIMLEYPNLCQSLVKELYLFLDERRYISLSTLKVLGSFDPQTQILTCTPKPDLQPVAG